MTNDNAGKKKPQEPGVSTPITRREALANLVAPLILSVPVALRAEAARAEALIPIRVPDLSKFTGVPVIAIWVKAGERVIAGAQLITVESTKATFDVHAPASGRVVEWFITVGSKVSEGDLIATLAVEPQPVPALDPASLAIMGGALAAAGAKLLDARSRDGAGPDGAGQENHDPRKDLP